MCTWTARSASVSGMEVAPTQPEGSDAVSSLVRLLGFTTLGCGCVVGKYREVATSREVAYVEEKGRSCASHGHRRNHTVTSERPVLAHSVMLAARAS